MELIYCAAGNPRFAQIAIDAGYLYGAQLPNTIYHAPYFVDQNWRNPDRKRYMRALAQYKPQVATVLDLERAEQLPEVLSWAEEAAQWVQTVIIIPKAQGIVAHLPRKIGGGDVRLGYSVPTKFAGTELPVWDFMGWPVHLLGGNPQNQMRLAHYMDVRSADGNAAQRAAMHGIEWISGKWQRSAYEGDDMPYRVWDRSCRNIKAAWQRAIVAAMHKER